jgi:SAM-dependent methyltransferase
MKRSPWQAALDCIREIPGYRSRSVIELGCGDGFLLEHLKADGCRVRGTTFLPRERDHVRERAYPPDLGVDPGIDLTRPLPYPDGAFGVVLCAEVIEHLEVHSSLIAEAARILEPGGFLVLTSPNLGRVVSRIHFALTGVHLTKERRPTGSDPLARIGAFHVRCVDFPHLHWLLWQNGLRIERLAETQVRLSGRLCSWLSPLFHRLARRALLRHGVGMDDETRDLLAWVRTRAYSRSEHLCVVARRHPAAG